MCWGFWASDHHWKRRVWWGDVHGILVMQFCSPCFKRLHFPYWVNLQTEKRYIFEFRNMVCWFRNVTFLLHIKPWEWEVGQFSYGSEDNCRSVFALEPRILTLKLRLNIPDWLGSLVLCLAYGRCSVFHNQAENVVFNCIVLTRFIV